MAQRMMWVTRVSTKSSSTNSKEKMPLHCKMPCLDQAGLRILENQMTEDLEIYLDREEMY